MRRRGRQAGALSLVNPSDWGVMRYYQRTPEQTLIDWWVALAMREGDLALPEYDAGLDETIEQFSLDGRRADIVILHTRALRATVIEAKSGRGGVTHVAQGIGQALLYAMTFSVEFAIRTRPALLWSSLGNPADDALIAAICDGAGVLALPAPDITAQKAA